MLKYKVVLRILVQNNVPSITNNTKSKIEEQTKEFCVYVVYNYALHLKILMFSKLFSVWSG